jgi:ABC-type Co2+ transport system permease subunit
MMLGVHAVTGIAEGLITAASLTAIERLDPKLAARKQAS